MYNNEHKNSIVLWFPIFSSLVLRYARLEEGTYEGRETHQRRERAWGCPNRWWWSDSLLSIFVLLHLSSWLHFHVPIHYDSISFDKYIYMIKVLLERGQLLYFPVNLTKIFKIGERRRTTVRITCEWIRICIGWSTWGSGLENGGRDGSLWETRFTLRTTMISRISSTVRRGVVVILTAGGGGTTRSSWRTRSPGRTRSSSRTGSSGRMRSSWRILVILWARSVAGATRRLRTTSATWRMMVVVTMRRRFWSMGSRAMVSIVTMSGWSMAWVAVLLWIGTH